MVVDVRFELDDELTVDELIRHIGLGLEQVISGVPLENDGFGRLLPDEQRKQVFVA